MRQSTSRNRMTHSQDFSLKWQQNSFVDFYCLREIISTATQKVAVENKNLATATGSRNLENFATATGSRHKKSFYCHSKIILLPLKKVAVAIESGCRKKNGCRKNADVIFSFEVVCPAFLIVQKITKSDMITTSLMHFNRDALKPFKS